MPDTVILPRPLLLPPPTEKICPILEAARSPLAAVASAPGAP